MQDHSYPQNQQQLQPTIHREQRQRWGLILILVVVLGFLFGCAADHSAKNKELLSKNYQTLTDNDLILYYYELGDQIEVVEQERNNSSISLGFGMGSYGSGGGRSGGLGVTTGGSHSEVATDLRDRRNKVKLEMKKRNLKP